MRRKVSSDWLPSFIKAMRPVLEILNMAGFFWDRPRNCVILYIKYFGKALTQSILFSANGWKCWCVLFVDKAGNIFEINIVIAYRITLSCAARFAAEVVPWVCKTPTNMIMADLTSSVIAVGFLESLIWRSVKETDVLGSLFFTADKYKSHYIVLLSHYFFHISPITLDVLHCGVSLFCFWLMAVLVLCYQPSNVLQLFPLTIIFTFVATKLLFQHWK
jgi:hypothetical protein